MKFDMVFEGGGAKGMVFIGAMQAMGKNNHEVGRLLGTSAGAITATLLAAGYTPDEMLGALGETDDEGNPIFTTFMGTPGEFGDDEIAASVITSIFQRIDLPIPDRIEKKIDDYLIENLLKSSLFRHLFSFVERGGWYSADAFVTWFKGKMDSGATAAGPRAFSEMTFTEFHKATGRHLTLIAADISGNQILVLNHITAPDCPVVWAVRMSMSIPMLWQEVVWQAEWGKYQNKDISGHIVVDGGLLSNFPIELFLSEQRAVTSIMGDREGDMVIGCLIDEKVPLPNAPTEPVEVSSGGITSFPVLRRLMLMVDTVTGAHDKMVIDGVEHLVARLPAKGYGTTEFDMDVARREALIQAGEQVMQRFLKRTESAALSFSVQPTYKEESVDANALSILGVQP